MKAVFEPDKKVNDTSGNTAKTGGGTEIGTTTAVNLRHCQACPVTEALSGDLQQLIRAWPKLNESLKSAVMAIAQSDNV